MKRNSLRSILLAVLFTILFITLSSCSEETKTAVYPVGYSLFDIQDSDLTVTEQAFSINKEVGSPLSSVTVKYKLYSEETKTQALYFPYVAAKGKIDGLVYFSIDGKELSPSMRILERKTSDIVLSEYDYFCDRQKLFLLEEISSQKGICYTLTQDSLSLLSYIEADEEKPILSLTEGEGSRKIIFRGLQLQNNFLGKDDYVLEDDASAACFFVIGDDLEALSSPSINEENLYTKEELTLKEFFAKSNPSFSDNSSISVQIEDLRVFLSTSHSGNLYYKQREKDCYVLQKYDFEATAMQSIEIVLKYVLPLKTTESPNILTYKMENLSINLLDEEVEPTLSVTAPDMPYVKYFSTPFSENATIFDTAQLSFSLSSEEEIKTSAGDEKIETAIDGIYTIAVTSIIIYSVLGFLIILFILLIIVAVYKRYKSKTKD